MTDVFDQNTNKPEEKPVAPAIPNAFDDQLKGIKNEKGEPKYKDVASALNALSASQEHIKQLENEQLVRDAEILALRDEVKNKQALEEVVNRLSNNENKAKDQTVPNASLSEDAIVNVVENILKRKETLSVAQNNINEVSNKLTAKFGDKTKEAVAAKAAELKTTPEALGKLASENPDLVLSLFGESPKPANLTAPSSTTPLITPKVEGEIKRPDFSLLSGVGATDKNRKELMKQIRAKVYKDLEVTT